MASDNPYASPRSSTIALHGAVEPFESLQASRGKRFGTLLADYVCLFALGVAMAFGLANLGKGHWLQNLGFVGENLVGICLTSIFYFLFEGFSGRTLGKWIVGTKTVDMQGNLPSLKAVFIRTLCRSIPFEALSIFGSRAICWHDRFSHTRVVDLRKIRDYHAGLLEGLDTPPPSEPDKSANWREMSDAQQALWEIEHQKQKRQPL
jgi:uncharacterized RDD family membrane protein YckC